METTVGVERAVSLLLRAFYEPGAASEDSLRPWLYDASWYDTPGIHLGTARALTTRELRLISDDSLRAAVITLLDLAE